VSRASRGREAAPTSVSFASSPKVRRRMQRQRRRDTACELELRRILHRKGLRYRVDHRPISSYRRRADLVFSRARVAVFIDGCFWHGCPQHGTVPGTNSEWWAKKLARTRARDEETTEVFAAAGWLVVRVWEHEDPRSGAEEIARAVRKRCDQLAGHLGQSREVQVG
jgi:DNA mismatch endonuclease (patch repair protein)